MLVFFHLPSYNFMHHLFRRTLQPPDFKTDSSETPFYLNYLAFLAMRQLVWSKIKRYPLYADLLAARQITYGRIFLDGNNPRKELKKKRRSLLKSYRSQSNCMTSTPSSTRRSVLSLLFCSERIGTMKKCLQPNTKLCDFCIFLRSYIKFAYFSFLSSF